MCLIVLAWEEHPDYKLILAANRDEFYEREALPAHFWEDNPQLLAGRDLKSGGTWMGVTKQGKWAAVTNYRDIRNLKEIAPSRGNLTTGYLKSSLSPKQYIEKIKPEATLYNGFNLFIGNIHQLYYFSNQIENEEKLDPGIYGLSNHLLDTPWPKVEAAKTILKQAVERKNISHTTLLDILYNTNTYPDAPMPDTGLGREAEISLSSIFIRMPGYGSRCSTVLLLNHDNEVVFAERQYVHGKIKGPDSVFRIKLNV
jgi:uncharacterized protein with NRDE domain